jgi:hypothetical protein
MRKLIAVFTLSGLVFAGAAAAAGGPSISISLSPHKVKKNSKLTVNASGFPTETALPQSAELQVQRGFKSSAKSVKQLCSPGASTCPAASQIGTGTAAVTAGVPIFGSITDTINFTLYLGKPKRGGDIASVIVLGSDTYLHQSASGSGRLFKNSSGGLELLFDQFPTISGVPPGISITLNSLSFNAGAIRKVKKHHKTTTYSLITNPSTCSGSWTGSGSVTFTNGTTIPESFSTPCTK